MSEQQNETGAYSGGESNAGSRKIEKSGTGCHKSGSGIHHCIAASPRVFRPHLLALLVLVFICTAPLAAQQPPGFTTVLHKGSVLVTFETSEGVVTGTVSEEAGAEGYYQLILFTNTAGNDVSLLVKGSGSGTSSESCNDFGILVKGSGSGTASTDCSFDHPNAWGFAEVAIDGEAVLVTIHQVIEGVAVEFATVEL